MEYLARKISKGKWMPKAGMPVNAVRADVLISCLKTKDDELSTWQCTNEEDDIRQVILALATAGSTIETMDVVIIPKAEVHALGIRLEEKLGRTAVPDLQLRHLDLVRIEVQQLSSLALLIASQVRSGPPSCYRLTATKIRALIQQALDEGRINLALMQAELRDEFGAV